MFNLQFVFTVPLPKMDKTELKVLVIKKNYRRVALSLRVFVKAYEELIESLLGDFGVAVHSHTCSLTLIADYSKFQTPDLMLSADLLAKQLSRWWLHYHFLANVLSAVFYRPYDIDAALRQHNSLRFSQLKLIVSNLQLFDLWWKFLMQSEPISLFSFYRLGSCSVEHVQILSVRTSNFYVAKDCKGHVTVVD